MAFCAASHSTASDDSVHSGPTCAGLWSAQACWRNVGVAAVTTSQELVVFDAGTGFMRWGQEACVLCC